MDFLDLNRENNGDFEILYRKMLNKELKDGEEVVIKACVHRIREMAWGGFIILRTARRLVQCVYDKEQAKFAMSEIKEGDFVVMRGVVRVEERSKIGYDVIPVTMQKLSGSSEEIPFVLSKKELDVSLDTALDYRPISARHPKERAYFKIVEGIARGFREFLLKEGFTEFMPPKIVSAGAEGGAEMFSVDYFGRPAFLAQSPQAYKQMMVGVYEKVFCIGGVFRAEKHHTSRHINEFNGIDFEMGFIDSFYDVMDVEARALRYTFRLLNEEYADELELVGRKPFQDFEKVPTIRFRDAKALIKEKYNRDYHSENDLEPEEEKLLGEYFNKECGSELVFVTHYPSAKRPFYAMDDPEDPTVTLSFDLLLNGAEITTGGQRIHDYQMQLDKMKARGMSTEGFETYLMIHKYGIPPHGGLGIGLERLAMKLLGVDNIRRTTLFPRDTERLDP